jgi:hypothetical protein
MGPILTRSYYLNGHRHHEEVWKTGSNEFEIKGRAIGPRGYPYIPFPVCISELCRMSDHEPWVRAFLAA